MSDEYEVFLQDIGGLNADAMKFRPRARFTCAFGLTERYKYIEGEAVWGFPGIHKGVDRGWGDHEVEIDGETIDNPVYVPLNFGSSGVRLNHRIYGSEVFLYHKTGWRLRISHFYADDIRILDRLQQGHAIEKGTVIGPYGSGGFSTGLHTHTEVESWGFGGEWMTETPVLETLLREKYGEAADEGLTQADIMEIYGNCPQTRDWDSDRAHADYDAIMKQKSIVFINPYKLRVMNGRGQISTLYSTQHLFGM